MPSILLTHWFYDASSALTCPLAAEAGCGEVSLKRLIDQVAKVQSSAASSQTAAPESGRGVCIRYATCPIHDKSSETVMR
jgi:hypothetical protein